MPTESRMDRVMSGLNAMERAKLVLASYKTGIREDPLVRRMMPVRQYGAFNEHIYTMNAANMHIGMDADLQCYWARFLLLYYLDEWRYNLLEIEEAVTKAARGPRGAQR